MSGLQRNLEFKVNELLSFFPVVLIVGARQTGKTTLAQKCRSNWKYYDLEKSRDYDFISRDYDFFFQENSKEIIFDEAQELPQLFRELRGVIDSKRHLKNRFILTGSSSPELLNNVSDSLAGRVAIIEVGTFRVNETRQEPLSDFYQVFQNQLSFESISDLKKLKFKKFDVLEHLLHGGYPEPSIVNNDKFHQAWMEQYFQTYINRDVRKLFPRLDSIKFRRFISILSGLSGTIINKATVARSLDINEVTVRDYLDIAHKTFIWRQIPSYENSKIKAVIKMPKGIFRDSGLNHYLSNILTRDQMLNSASVGLNFESFVIEEILKGMNSFDIPKWEYYYYRTRNGSEVDLILTGNFGTLPIEIKFGTSTTLKSLTGIRKFVEENNLPFGIVINNSTEIKLLCDSILQIPINCI